ncbi:MAG: DUF2076 domain-containing protein [Candidatus Methylumidiphilus sp.]
MNPQERELLSQFLKQLGDARVGDKSAEAEALIRESIAKQPDAAYLLVQRALLLEQALNTAKAQIAQLQSQVQAQQPPGGGRGSFLGGGNPWAAAPEAGANPAGVPGAGSYQMPRAGFAANAAAPAAAPAGGGVGSFLGSMATTAAGVVAGGFLFQGIESLLGGHHGGSSSLWGDSGSEPVAEQTIINNYYGSPDDNALADNSGWGQSDDVGSFLAGNDPDPLLDDDSGNDDSDWG